MNKIILHYIILSIVLLFAACKKDSFCNCTQNTGKEITETRTISPFTSIEMNNNVDVILKPDTFFSLKVTCGKNLLDGIKTEVTNNQLRISNINRCNWLRDFQNKFTVEITLPTIEQITNQGSGNLNCSDTIKGNELQVDNWDGTGVLNFLIDYEKVRFKLHTGPADIYASGKVFDGFVYSAGNGFFKGAELHSDFFSITTKSTGDCEIDVSTELWASIEYQGDVYYSGNPIKITNSISGTGQLIHR